MNKQAPTSTRRFVDASEICADLGICKMTLQRWEQAGKFPRAIRPGGGRKVWLREMVDRWAISQAEAAQEQPEASCS